MSGGTSQQGELSFPTGKLPVTSIEPPIKQASNAKPPPSFFFAKKKEVFLKEESVSAESVSPVRGLVGPQLPPEKEAVVCCDFFSRDVNHPVRILCYESSSDVRKKPQEEELSLCEEECQVEKTEYEETAFFDSKVENDGKITKITCDYPVSHVTTKRRKQNYNTNTQNSSNSVCKIITRIDNIDAARNPGYNNSLDRILERTYEDVEILGTNEKTSLELEDAIALEIMKQNEYLKRPARRQVEIGYQAPVAYTEGQQSYNIWYHKFESCREDYLPRAPADTRCALRTDAGYTRAAEGAPFCLYFAKGCCAAGEDCVYRHYLPLNDDEDATKDVFGRERFAQHKDDMGGVGTFEAEDKTLFIGRINNMNIRALQTALYHNFVEWGPIKTLRIIPRKNLAFISFALKASAEFAKMAMSDQDIGSFGRVINVRWAHQVTKEHLSKIIAKQKNAALKEAEVRAAAAKQLEEKEKLVEQTVRPITADDSYLNDYLQGTNNNNNNPVIGPTTPQQLQEQRRHAEVTNNVTRMSHVLNQLYPADSSVFQVKL